MTLLGSLSLCLLCILCLLPAPQVTDHHRKSFCNIELKSIAFALQAYHETYGSFPPAHVADANGKPMHSWRVLILPFAENRVLYRRYNFSEPWNGPSNSKLARHMPGCYHCPGGRGDSAAPPLTHYVAIVGSGTVWPGAKATKAAEVTDPPGDTILIAEASGAPVHWMEPRDLNLGTMSLSVNPRDGKGISSRHPWRGAHVAMVDGSVVFLSEKKCSPATLRALLTISGGEKVVVPTDE